MLKILPLLFAIGFLVFPVVIQAQNFDIAYTYQLKDTEAKSGDIISNDGNNGLIRSSKSYDSNLLGVMQLSPILVYRNGEENSVPIVRTGDTTVNVTDFNGEIKQGDYVTSSEIAGKGMKAIDSGYVIGVATEDSKNIDQKAKQGDKEVNLYTVKVALRIEYAELNKARNSSRLFDALSGSLFENVKDPDQFGRIVRYIIAGLIGVISFTLGLLAISRITSKGMEAIGRNPLAKNSIQMSIGINLFVVVVVLIIVAVLDVLIIRL